jgi:hypothetical protein
MSATLAGALLRCSLLAVLALRRIERLAAHPARATSISQFLLSGYLIPTKNLYAVNHRVAACFVKKHRSEPLVHFFSYDLK